MKRPASLRLAVLGGLVALLVVAAPAIAASTASVKISESDNRYHFTPTTVYVNAGGKVAWTNGSDAPHTVTSDTGTELASSTLGAGKTFTHTFTTAGTFAYHCSIHRYMVGSVVVLAAGATPPPTDTVETVRPRSGDVGIWLVLAGVVGLGGAAIVLRRLRRAP